MKQATKKNLYELGDKYLDKTERLLKISHALNCVGLYGLSRILQRKSSETFAIACSTLSMAARMDIKQKDEHP